MGLAAVRLKHMIADPLNRAGKALARRRMEHEGLLPLLEGRPKDAFPAEYDDLWFLYSEAWKRKPRMILEFGSGFSTSVLAEALLRNRLGKLYSVDAIEPWAEITRKALRPNHPATIVYTPAVKVGEHHWRHERLPNVVPDFIYLDGPPLSKDRPVAVDVLDLEPRLNPGCFLVVDGRKTNTRYLQEHFARDWSFSWDRIAQRAVFELRH